MLSNQKHPHAPIGIRPTARHRERAPRQNRPQDSEIRELASRILSQVENSRHSVQVALSDQEYSLKCSLPTQDLMDDGRIDQVSRAHWVAARLLELNSMYPNVRLDVDRVLRETTRLGTYPEHPAKSDRSQDPVDLQTEWVAWHSSLNWDGTTPSEMAASLRVAGIPVR